MKDFPLTLHDIYTAAKTGDYPVLGQSSPEIPKVVLSYGTAETVNRQIVEFGLENNTDATQLLADENSARYFLPGEHQPITFIGSISPHRYGRRPGTSGILRATRRLLSPASHERPQLRIATHARLAARVALQAYVEGLSPILEPAMPDFFDETSEQAWTTSPEAWIEYERKFLMAYSALKLAQRKLPKGVLNW